jgi:predicted nucleotidyltransferase
MVHKKVDNVRLDRVLKMFIKEIRSLATKIDSIYLFGSRVKKTFRPDSDYDLLVVVTDKTIRDRLYEIAVDVFCRTEADISLKIVKRADFNSMKRIGMPFIANVLKEGLKIA